MVVLTGARQTGKTSTFLRLFPKHGFVSLDLPAEAEQAEKQPGTFLRRHPPPVLIDEVQYAPGLFRHLKVAVDANRTRNAQFLLTGSQKFTLMKDVSESLAGRADIVVRGGFPELWFAVEGAKITSIRWCDRLPHTNRLSAREWISGATRD